MNYLKLIRFHGFYRGVASQRFEGKKNAPTDMEVCPSFVLLGVFAKLREATISFVMSVCPSVRMEQLG
jgi:hypothetical protein